MVIRVIRAICPKCVTSFWRQVKDGNTFDLEQDLQRHLRFDHHLESHVASKLARSEVMKAMKIAL